MLKNQTIIELSRNDIVEKAYLGSLIALDKNGNKILEFSYNPLQNIIFRSMQKPFQAYSFMRSGAFKKFNLNEKHLAVISGSHAGTLAQITLVKEILRKSGFKVNDLKCPKDYPLDIETKNYLIKNSKRKSQIYDNCSGKHAGMLAACAAYGFDAEGYMNLNHPIQRKIISETLKLCEFPNEVTATDGCGVPVLAMPLEHMANGLQNLYKTHEGEKIIKAAIKYPMLYGGKNRFDSDIIKLTKGKVFAKVGAAGLVGLLNIQTGEALVVKIFADDHPARAQVTLDYMKKLNWIN